MATRVEVDAKILEIAEVDQAISDKLTQMVIETEWIVNPPLPLTGVLDVVNTPPGAVPGDRYLVGTSPTGDFVGHENEIATYDGPSWSFVAPIVGNSVEIGDPIYLEESVWTGATWESTICWPGTGPGDANAKQVTTWQMRLDDFYQMADRIVDCQLSSTGLQNETVNYIILMNTYLTLKFMYPQPDYYLEVSPPTFSDIQFYYGTATTYSGSIPTNVRDNILSYDNREYVGTCENRGTLETDANNTGTDTSAFKVSALTYHAAQFNAMMLNVGIEFSFAEKGKVDLAISKTQKATIIYSDPSVITEIIYPPNEIPEPVPTLVPGYGLENWITSHGLPIPIYPAPEIP